MSDGCKIAMQRIIFYASEKSNPRLYLWMLTIYNTTRIKVKVVKSIP